MKRIEVFISECDGDRRIGTLEYDELRGKEVSSFELDEDFVLHPSVSFLGPDIGLFRGKQYQKNGSQDIYRCRARGASLRARSGRCPEL